MWYACSRKKHALSTQAHRFQWAKSCQLTSKDANSQQQRPKRKARNNVSQGPRALPIYLRRATRPAKPRDRAPFVEYASTTRRTASRVSPRARGTRPAPNSRTQPWRPFISTPPSARAASRVPPPSPCPLALSLPFLRPLRTLVKRIRFLLAREPHLERRIYLDETLSICNGTEARIYRWEGPRFYCLEGTREDDL